jgi:mRNA interferase MazF
MVALDPALGSEATKTRPAIVVSNNTANAAASRSDRGVITVVPVTSNIARAYPSQVVLPASRTGLPRDSKAQAEQVRTVSVIRVREVVGWISAELMGEVDDALRMHLAL